MKLLKSFCCATMALAFASVCRAEISTNVINKLISKGEFEIAAEILSDEVNINMSRRDVDEIMRWIETLSTKLRGGSPDLTVKRFVPPDPAFAHKTVKGWQSSWRQLGIWLSDAGVAWENDAQRVLVSCGGLNQTSLLSADEAQKELNRFDEVKKIIEMLSKVVIVHCKTDDEDWEYYIEAKKKLASIKERIKKFRTCFLSYEVVSPYLYEAHSHLFVGISDSVRVSSFNIHCADAVKECRIKGVKLLAKACHNAWLYSCSQDVRDQFIEIHQFMKRNLGDSEMDEIKVISTLSDCNDPSKVRSADYWWK